MRATNIKTLIESLYILSRDIQSQDGIANACIAEGAEALQNHHEQLKKAKQTLQRQKEVLESEELKEDVAREIWEVAQAYCKYTVDPTQEECRLLAKAVIKAIKDNLK